jgi:hypothetical protein
VTAVPAPGHTSPGHTSVGHTVLADADGTAYASLRQRPAARAERYAMGKALRKRVPRSALAHWAPPDDRPDPVALVRASHSGRVPDLVPVRVERMTASPYGFLRGSAVVMAHDVAHLPATGIRPVVCGDAHLGNFGFYASPERDLVIDLNDFDEAHPGGWEWDLRRLGASIWVAGRQNGAGEDHCAAAVASCAAAYREEIRHLAAQPLLSRSYERLDVDRLGEQASGSLRAEVRRAADRARRRTSDRALPRFTHEVGGARRIVEEPPLITRLPDEEAEAVGAALDDYLHTLGPALAARAGRLHDARRGAQGRRRRQRRTARLRGAAGGLRPRRRRVPAAQAGAALGAGPVRARQLGLHAHQGSGSWSTSRPCRPCPTRCSAGRACRTGRGASASSTCGSSAT